MIVVRVSSESGQLRGRLTLVTDVSERATEQVSHYASPARLREAVLAAIAELIGDAHEPPADEAATGG